MKNIILVGCAGHAKVVMDIIEQEGKYKIVALFDRPEKIDTIVYGYPIIDTEDNLSRYIKDLNIQGGIIAIGDNFIRKKVSETILGQVPDFEYINAIHPSAQVGKNVTLGNGIVMVAGSVVNSDSVVGDHCILNTNSSLGHEGVMKNFSCLSSNATIGGAAEIGECSVVALSATVLHNKMVGDHTVIGAGAVVTRDIPSNVLAYGTPCKVIQSRKIGESYL